MKKQFVVTIETHDDVQKTLLRDHVRDAIKSWGGRLHPDDELFPTNFKSVKVRPLNNDLVHKSVKRKN